jgi:hypothetical protein
VAVVQTEQLDLEKMAVQAVVEHFRAVLAELQHLVKVIMVDQVHL